MSVIITCWYPAPSPELLAPEPTFQRFASAAQAREELKWHLSRGMFIPEMPLERGYLRHRRGDFILELNGCTVQDIMEIGNDFGHSRQRQRA